MENRQPEEIFIDHDVDPRGMPFVVRGNIKFYIPRRNIRRVDTVKVEHKGHTFDDARKWIVQNWDYQRANAFSLGSGCQYKNETSIQEVRLYSLDNLEEVFFKE